MGHESKHRSRSRSQKKHKEHKKSHKSRKEHKSKRDKRSRSQSKERHTKHKNINKKQEFLEDKYDNKNRKTKSYSRSRSKDSYKDDKKNNYSKLSYKEQKRLQREREQKEDEQALKDFKSKQQREDEEQKNKQYQKKDKKQNQQNKDQNHDEEGNQEEKDLEKPNFEATGLLAQENNAVDGVTIKFTQPQDAVIPKEKWRLYQYKGDEDLPTIHLRGGSSFLFGKDPRVADVLLGNQSCSGQHAVIQFREKMTLDPDTGYYDSETHPYLMDLESTNGTKLNGKQIEGARYYQLFPKDMLQFGYSDREYILMKFENNQE